MPGLLDPLTALAPAAVAGGTAGRRRIDLFFTVPDLGRMSRPNLWHRWWVEGRGWLPEHGWEQRGGCWTSAVTAVIAGGRVEVFGLGLDGSLWRTTGSAETLDGPGEWPRTSLGHPRGRRIVTSPAAVVPRPGTLLVGVRTQPVGGVRPGLWFASSEGGSRWRWRGSLAPGWPGVHGEFATALGMASRWPGAVDVLTVTKRFELRHAWMDNGATGPWSGFGEDGAEGGLTSSPSAAVWSHPRGSSLHVLSCYGPFPSGATLDRARIELKSWLGRHWGPQRAVYTEGNGDGRRILGPPVLCSWGRPRLDAFFLSSDAAGGDPALTRGWSEDTRVWDWSERLPLPL